LKHLLFAFLLALALAAGSADAQDNCAINPGACQARPMPSDCQPGQHWTLIGSGIAHCVADDPPCSGTVNHDALGNPTNCQTSTSKTVGCGSGYTGQINQRRAKYTWMDGSVTYGGWSTTSNTCEAIPPPPPPPVVPEPTPTPTPVDNGGGGGTGGNGDGGTVVTNPPVTDPDPVKCTNGASDYPTCTPPRCQNGASDYPACTPPKCQNGASDYPTCTPPTCANGATNFPACSSFPGCPRAGEVINRYCYTRAEYNGGGGDCIEPTMYWGVEFYNDDAQCSVGERLEGSTGTYEGYCPGRTPAKCPPGY